MRYRRSPHRITRRADRLRNQVRFTRQVGFVHRPAAPNHHSVHGTDLMGKHRQHIAHPHLFQINVDDFEPARRWAMLGRRLASAPSTADARRVTYCSSALPPESINTTIEPARYSPISADVTIERPARRSEPNSPVSAFFARSITSGTPPIRRTAMRIQ